MISYINDIQHKCHIAEATNKITRVYIGKYEKVSNRLTRANDGYNTTFETMRVKSNVYARYPYYKGANMWQNLPMNIHNSYSKEQFKNCPKLHLK